MTTRLLDGIDSSKAQYRSFCVYMHLGAQQLSLACGKVAPAESVGFRTDDLLIVPPYGAWINSIRNGLNINCAVLMVDLKGPVGIDAALMAASRVRRFAYASPLVGDSRFIAEFSSLISAGINIFPLPYFPAPRVLESTDILTEIPTPYRQRIVAYAGSIWGERASFIEHLVNAIGDKLMVRNDLPASRYVELLRRALIALDFAGAEAPTYRFAEILLTGAACVTQRRPVFVLPPQPVEGREMMTFTSGEELEHAVESLLSSPDRATALGRGGEKWYRATQGPQQYVSYLLRVGLGKVLPMQSCVCTPSFWSSWSREGVMVYVT